MRVENITPASILEPVLDVLDLTVDARVSLKNSFEVYLQNRLSSYLLAGISPGTLTKILDVDAAPSPRAERLAKSTLFELGTKKQIANSTSQTALQVTFEFIDQVTAELPETKRTEVKALLDATKKEFAPLI